MSSLLRTILEPRSRAHQSDLVGSDTGWWSGPLGGKTKAGTPMDEWKAMNLATVWTCVEGISSDVAVLPLPLYRRLAGGGKEKARDHPVFRLLTYPNPRMTGLSVRETLLAHALNWGRGIAEIERDGEGRPLGIWPLRPDCARPETRKGELFWRYTKTSGEAVMLPDADVFHVHGLGFDGITGYNVIRMARESMGAAAAADEYAQRFFGNGALPATLLKHPGKLKAEGAKNLRESFREIYGGLENSSGMAVLEEGMTLEKFSIPPDEAQFLETRQFHVSEICRWYRYPPHKAGDLSRATFSNIEQQDLSYGTSCLLRWFVRIEQEITRKLLRTEEQGEYFAEHTFNAFLRADVKTRFLAYKIGRDGGWLSADDVREMENQNPLPGGQGKIYSVALNTVPADTLLDKDGDDAPVAPAPPAPRAGVLDRRALLAIADASRPSLEAAYAQLIRVEADKLGRAESRGQLAAFADTFFPQHVEHVRGLLWPVVESSVRAACGVAGTVYAGDAARGLVHDLAARHVEASRRSGTGTPGEPGVARAASQAEDAARAIAAAMVGHLIKESPREHLLGTPA